MTPGARAAAVIELLERVADGAQAGEAPADAVLSSYFRGRRYIGAKDRRAIADAVFDVLRLRPALDWWIGDDAPDNRRRVIALALLHWGWDEAALDAAFDGGRYRPPPLDEDERALAARLAGQALITAAQPAWVKALCPRWLYDRFEAAFGGDTQEELAALARAAPVDLRVNTLKTSVDEAMAALNAAGIEAVPTALSPIGLRLTGRHNLAGTQAFKAGWIEPQDEGSQLVALLVGARPGMHVLDFCAGAGGKTLALAAAMRGEGRLVATDVAPGRLRRLEARARRAGADVEIAALRDGGLTGENAPAFDRVLIDAPCSGTGVWRRAPDAKWRLSEAELARLADRQAAIINHAAEHVRPGGRLIYATCSLLPEENDAQIERFQRKHHGFFLRDAAELWAEETGRTGPPGVAGQAWLTPLRCTTDGFFVAVLERMA